MTSEGRKKDSVSANECAAPDAQILASPPSRTQLAAIMSEAEDSAPIAQEIKFALADGQKYLLSINYQSKEANEPIWVLSTLDEVPPTVFWNISTENPEQIYNLILKRVRNTKTTPQARPAENKVETEPQSRSSQEDTGPMGESEATYRNIPDAQPIGSFFNDRYVVLSEIGSGGMSRVYKAKDKRDGKTVAVKVLHPHLLKQGIATNTDPRKRFEQEFKATMALGHDNIVNVTDHGFTDEGLPFMVMEYINGHSLEQLLRAQNRMKLSQFFTTFYQTLSALIHAHERGVVHRDVKPSNIMMIKTEQNVNIVKLLDFGIAKVFRENTGGKNDQNITQTGDIFGSPFYMSPEQCKGENLDARSDIYSLGCVMYQALTGKRPFEGENAYKTIYLHVNIMPPSFGMVRPDLSLPKKLEAIVMKCLEKKPQNRYQEARELRLELERLAQENNEESEGWVTKQTKSGTFYAVHPTSGKEESAIVISVLKLLLHAGIIDNDAYARASHLDDTSTAGTSKWLVQSGFLDNKTLHAAVKCQALIERKDLKLEKAVIALNYCQRMRVGLDEALEELGWKI
ncbi:MAG: serine/threonine-protein kinase [Cyanobacteriota/Melainabacteria group bacterium]